MKKEGGEGGGYVCFLCFFSLEGGILGGKRRVKLRWKWVGGVFVVVILYIWAEMEPLVPPQHLKQQFVKIVGEKKPKEESK